jgi:hypothetical protein
MLIITGHSINNLHFLMVENSERPGPISREDTLARLRAARIPKKPKEDKGLNKRSEKLKELFKGYIKLVKIFLARPENVTCQIDMEGCTKIATCVHHVSGRTRTKLKDEKDWMASCESCNLWVEVNDGKARELGFKKSRLGKINKP